MLTQGHDQEKDCQDHVQISESITSQLKAGTSIMSTPCLPDEAREIHIKANRASDAPVGCARAVNQAQEATSYPKRDIRRCLQQSQFLRAPDSFGAVAHLEFAVDVFEVLFNGARRDEECLSDLFVG